MINLIGMALLAAFMLFVWVGLTKMMPRTSLLVIVFIVAGCGDLFWPSFIAAALGVALMFGGIGAVHRS